MWRGLFLCAGVAIGGCGAGRPLESDDGQIHFYNAIADDVSEKCVSCHSDPIVSRTFALVRDDDAQRGINYKTVRSFAMAHDGGRALLYHHANGGFLGADALARWEEWISEGAPR